MMMRSTSKPTIKSTTMTTSTTPRKDRNDSHRRWSKQQSSKTTIIGRRTWTASKLFLGETKTTTKAQNWNEPQTVREEYKHHTRGKVVFQHEKEEEKSKWANCDISHVGFSDDDRTDDDDLRKIKLGIVIGEFHDQLMNRMLEDARLSALAMNAEITRVVFVPGTYEAPLILENMLQDETLDCACVLGYIEKGSTLHGEEMGNTCSLIFKQLELEYSKPVGMGIIGPGATAEQAETRIAYAGNAVRAAIRMARAMTIL